MSLGEPFAAQVLTRAVISIGAQRTDVQQPLDAGPAAGHDDPLRQLSVHGAESRAITAAFVQDADQVDDRVLPGAQRRDLLRVTQVGTDHADGR